MYLEFKRFGELLAAIYIDIWTKMGFYLYDNKHVAYEMNVTIISRLLWEGRTNFTIISIEDLKYLINVAELAITVAEKHKFILKDAREALNSLFHILDILELTLHEKIAAIASD